MKFFRRVLQVFFCLFLAVGGGGLFRCVVNEAHAEFETVDLYRFSDDLVEAVEKCLPYHEDFVANNPSLQEAAKKLSGGEKLQIPVEIFGLEGDLCRFSVQYNVLGQKNIYQCTATQEQRRELLEAMKDRSLEPVTETFGIVQQSSPYRNNGDSAATEMTVTGGRFVVTLTKLQYNTCRLMTEIMSVEEQENAMRQARMLPQMFLQALPNCEPSMADFRTLDETEHVEILGWVQGECHIAYRNFDLYVPKEKLPEIKTFDDVADLILNVENLVYDYRSAYNYNGLLFELAACYRKTKQVENYRDRVNYGEKMQIINGVMRRSDENICEIELVNVLVVNDKQTDYGVICKIPVRELEDIVAPYLSIVDEYGEKTFANADGNMEWHRGQSNSDTRRIDAKLMYTLQKNNYCKMKNENL